MKHRLNEWAVVCFTVNVIMGSGFLDVPHAMFSAGIIPGVATLVGVTVMQWIATCLLAEVVARSHALLSKRDFAVSPVLVPLAKRECESASKENLGTWEDGLPVLEVPSETSFEVMALCRLHLGRTIEAVVGCFVLLYLLGTLWSYADVFASSLASAVPIIGINGEQTCAVYAAGPDGEPSLTTDPACLELYYAWLIIFAVSMSFVCLFELEEQVAFQVKKDTQPPRSHGTATRAALARENLGHWKLNKEAHPTATWRNGPNSSTPSLEPAVRWRDSKQS